MPTLPPLLAYRQELPYRPLWPLARRLASREPGVAFLDSSCEPQAEGRWSLLGWRPRRTLSWPTGRAGALDGLRHMLAARQLKQLDESPVPFFGGYLGWISYDLGRHIEQLPADLPLDPSMPDFVLAEYESLLVEDRLERRLYLTGAVDGSEGPTRALARQAEALEHFAAIDAAGSGHAPPPEGPAADSPQTDLERAEFVRRVEAVLGYIRAGDIFQANLSQRFTCDLRVSPIELYARLRAASPNPYGCYLDLGGPQVLSSSPELFLERRGERVVTRPIKGTRPRSADPERDAVLRAELESCDKERAELAMIVDLMRNDLGRVAETGSVAVDRARDLVVHPTVHHAVATVSARLGREVDATSLLAATMPGGSITGAPKIRAMEILEELEDVRRGPYCGVAGWFGHGGDLELNILIRTLVVQQQRVSFHVGGGIVADSDPEREYEETLHKAHGMLDALGADEHGPGRGSADAGGAA